VRDFAADLLRDLHCRVTPAADGKQAIELALANDFDLIFSDVVMPGVSGLQLAKLIAKERPNLPVLLATGYSAELIGDQSHRFKVVAKPYDVGTLAAAIAALLEEQNAPA
jgi:CheY-like chemotaxis protein